MSPVRMERIESGVRTIIAFVEAYNRCEPSGMLQLLSDDCQFEASTPAPDGSVYRGKAVILQYWQDFFIQYPHAHLKIEETIGFGLRCVVRWRCDWIDAAGQAFHLRGTDLFRVQNGLISEHLSYIKG